MLKMGAPLRQHWRRSTYRTKEMSLFRYTGAFCLKGLTLESIEWIAIGLASCKLYDKIVDTVFSCYKDI